MLARGNYLLPEVLRQGRYYKVEWPQLRTGDVFRLFQANGIVYYAGPALSNPYVNEHGIWEIAVPLDDGGLKRQVQ